MIKSITETHRLLVTSSQRTQKSRLLLPAFSPPRPAHRQGLPKHLPGPQYWGLDVPPWFPPAGLRHVSQAADVLLPRSHHAIQSGKQPQRTSSARETSWDGRPASEGRPRCHSDTRPTVGDCALQSRVSVWTVPWTQYFLRQAFHTIQGFCFSVTIKSNVCVFYGT